MKDLVQAIKVIRNGGTYFTSSARKVLQEYMDALVMGDLAEVREVQDGLKRLTIREREVFALLADGLTSKDIAERLLISPKTAETHKYNIMEKLKVSSVAQLTKIALEKGLIEV
jgi:DNA-binding NarL/FixJ family response regulator